MTDCHTVGLVCLPGGDGILYSANENLWTVVVVVSTSYCFERNSFKRVGRIPPRVAPLIRIHFLWEERGEMVVGTKELHI